MREGGSSRGRAVQPTRGDPPSPSERPATRNPRHLIRRARGQATPPGTASPREPSHFGRHRPRLFRLWGRHQANPLPLPRIHPRRIPLHLLHCAPSRVSRDTPVDHRAAAGDWRPPPSSRAHRGPSLPGQRSRHLACREESPTAHRGIGGFLERWRLRFERRDTGAKLPASPPLLLCLPRGQARFQGLPSYVPPLFPAGLTPDTHPLIASPLYFPSLPP
mmetsp:Transcript_65317/g.147352  ORF Transcript_65317/g.147352 Transcript_65317/m.147352 type:complete len:219 (-) Transcript_65317:365-1021(-)